MPDFDLDLDRVATGGTAIGTGPDGRLVFASGGLPGERVRVAVRAEHRTRIEATVVAVLDQAPQRRDPPCAHVADGCGGCDWQHVTPGGQRELRRSIVADCLRRLGGFPGVTVAGGPDLASTGYRTTVRAAVVDGRAGFRAAASHRVVTVDACDTAHPLVEEILVEGRFGAATEVTVRVGARTGDRLVIVEGPADQVLVPDDVTVIGADALAAGVDAHHHEEIGGRRLRISARSFFQCRPDGAEALVELVGAAIAGIDGPLLDAYCGVGLFGVLLGDGRTVTGVEWNRSSVADAVVNHHRPDGSPPVTTVRARVERWRPAPAAAVVADPARAGLRRPAVEVLVATGAEVIALVSCDPASLARDARLLVDAGYDLDRVEVVEMFAQTSHVETVSRFVRR